MQHVLHARDDAAAVQLEEDLPADLLAAYDTGAVQHRQVAGNHRPVLRHLGSDCLHVGAAVRGEHLHDVDAHRLAEGAEQLRIEDRREFQRGVRAATAVRQRRHHHTRAYVHMYACASTLAEQNETGVRARSGCRRRFADAPVARRR